MCSTWGSSRRNPVFAEFGALGVDPAAGFNIDCYGHDSMSDFYPNGPPEEGTVLGMAYQEPHPQGWFGQVCPLCEYAVGDGTIIISGWRFTVFRSGDEGCEDHDKMVLLHENILEYLGGLALVEAAGQVARGLGRSQPVFNTCRDLTVKVLPSVPFEFYAYRVWSCLSHV